MQLAILKVILWPKDRDLAPRIIPFEVGKINVVTGENGSGKSTITWIIDYCLGSEKCSIPVGLIRDLTEWFGLHLKLANTEMIVARRNPGEQQGTNELYWAEGFQLQVPPIVPGRNARVEDLKHRFNQISHLTSLDFTGGEDTGFGGPPSFRDMSSFNFQPQHIVANPYTFFYKADTTGNREKLKIVFPLVLGAVTSRTLAIQRELKDLDREHDRLRRELDARLNAGRAWETEVESYHLQARSLGLLSEKEPHRPGLPFDRYVAELREVPTRVRSLDLPEIQEGTSETAAAELNRIVVEEDRIAQETGSLRRRLEKVEQLSTSLNEYAGDLINQEDRLQGVGWLEEKLSSQHVCPVCAAVHNDGNSQLDELKVLAHQMTALTTSVSQAPARLDQELATMRNELREKESALSNARRKRKFLESESSSLAAERQRIRQIYLFVGRVEQALENLSTSRNVDELTEQVKSLSTRISELKRELDPAAQRDRLSAAIDKVSATIARYANLLKLEHRTENVRLNVRELTLQFSPLSGRTDFLWEVGSGQNWVGYHIAGLLSLHEQFLALKENPVPEFLVIDQPSQVYFPEAWPSMEEEPPATAGHDRSPDIEGVHRIFTALSAFMEKLPNFQIIVTEHAGSMTWRGVSGINLVGNWREGKDEFLIPSHWIPRQ